MGSCEKKKIEDYIVSIPDFPEKGIIFRDVTSILQDAEGFALAIDSLQKLLEGTEVDVIAAAESRGFIFGAPIAYNLHKPLVLIRKKGKLPRKTIEQSYDLEYGSAVPGDASGFRKTRSESSDHRRSDRYRRHSGSRCKDDRKAWRKSSEDDFPHGTCRTERKG